MPKAHGPIIEGKYKLNEDTRVIPIVEQKEDNIQWECIVSIYMDTGEPETIKEEMSRPIGH